MIYDWIVLLKLMSDWIGEFMIRSGRVFHGQMALANEVKIQVCVTCKYINYLSCPISSELSEVIAN